MVAISLPTSALPKMAGFPAWTQNAMSDFLVDTNASTVDLQEQDVMQIYNVQIQYYSSTPD